MCVMSMVSRLVLIDVCITKHLLIPPLMIVEQRERLEALQVRHHTHKNKNKNMFVFQERLDIMWKPEKRKILDDHMTKDPASIVITYLYKDP